MQHNRSRVGLAPDKVGLSVNLHATPSGPRRLTSAADNRMLCKLRCAASRIPGQHTSPENTSTDASESLCGKVHKWIPTPRIGLVLTAYGRGPVTPPGDRFAGPASDLLGGFGEEFAFDSRWECSFRGSTGEIDPAARPLTNSPAVVSWICRRHQLRGNAGAACSDSE
jgi:hypothetical protein